MGAFQSGFQLGQSAYNAAQDRAFREREMAIQEAKAERDAKQFQWQQDDRNRLDSAFGNYTNVAAGVSPELQGQVQQTYGLNPQQIAQTVEGGGAEGLRARLAGYDTPDSSDLQSVPQGLQRFSAASLPAQFTPGGDLARERALEGVSVAQRDVKGIRDSRTQQKQIQRDEDMRTFLSNTQQLFAKANSPDATDEDRAALATALAPHTRMISGYSGLDFDVRVNPKTGALEQIPYKGGAVTPVTFEQAAPYLMQSHLLLSEHGSPEKAVEELNKMSEAKRAQVIADGTRKLAQGQAVGKSINDANVAESGRITADAARTKANSDAARNKAVVDAMDEARKYRTDAAAVADEWDKLTPEQQAGPEGDALLRRFNLANAKAGGQVGLQRKDTPAEANAKTKGRSVLQVPVDQKKNDDGTYTAFAKDGGHALYNTVNGEAIPLGMSSTEYNSVKSKTAATNGKVKLVAGEEGGRLVLKYQGSDGKFYDDLNSALYAKPARAASNTQPSTQGPDALPITASGLVTKSRDPVTEKTTYSVTGLRRKFSTREEAEAAAKGVSDSTMGKTLSRYED